MISIATLTFPVCLVFVAVIITKQPLMEKFSTPLVDWHSHMKTFTFQGFSISYQDDQSCSGTSSPVLALHGFPSFSYDWKKIWPFLCSRHSRVVAIDFLGFGFSDKPQPHAYTIEEQADLAEALLENLDIKTVHLLGHDYGDTVVQELLARFEDGKAHKSNQHPTVLSVCLSNGGVFPEIHQERLAQSILKNWLVGPTAASLMFFKAFERSFGEIFGVKPADEEMSDYWNVINYKNGKAALSSLLSYIQQRRDNRGRWVVVLQQTSVPVHMVYGPADPVNPSPSFPDHFRKMLPQASITILAENIGHYPQLEDPIGFFESYQSFIEKIEEKTR